MALWDPVRALRDGSYRLRLDDGERRTIRVLCDELRALIEADAADVARLFPAAYRDDEDASAEYDELMRRELASGRLDALRTVESTLAAERLDEEQLAAWCGALNDLRLVLGERLDVQEDTFERGLDRTDPRAPQLALYAWLTWLQDSVVKALASRL